MSVSLCEGVTCTLVYAVLRFLFGHDQRKFLDLVNNVVSKERAVQSSQLDLEYKQLIGRIVSCGTLSSSGGGCGD